MKRFMDESCNADFVLCHLWFDCVFMKQWFIFLWFCYLKPEHFYFGCIKKKVFSLHHRMDMCQWITGILCTSIQFVLWSDTNAWQIIYYYEIAQCSKMNTKWIKCDLGRIPICTLIYMTRSYCRDLDSWVWMCVSFDHHCFMPWAFMNPSEEGKSM